LILDIAYSVESLIRRHIPGSSERPVVLKVAFTGIAAGAINGATMHSTFGLPFGNKFSGLTDEKRDAMRNTLSDLSILIIDEISMVKPDILYQVHYYIVFPFQASFLQFTGTACQLFF
jgi:hypothetical protein